eukprot:15478542-Alexandrium_andersonii.AAC.1
MSRSLARCRNPGTWWSHRDGWKSTQVFRKNSFRLKRLALETQAARDAQQPRPLQKLSLIHI